MKDAIVQGLQQAYQNMSQMIAQFLPRLVVMLVIVLTGVLVAYAFKYAARMILRLTKLDRLSEEAGASKVLRMAALPSMTEVLSRSVFWITLLGFILIGISVLNIAGLAGTDSAVAATAAGNCRCDVDSIPRFGHRKLFVARGFAGFGEQRLRFSDAV